MPLPVLNQDPSIPSVSVVIAAYNAMRYIGETLSSIKNQTYPPTEIIVVDDGSTDDTVKVVRQFADVKVVKISNRGAAAARNVGLSHVNGEWVAFCDADDVWLPNKLEKQCQLAARYPELRCVICDYIQWTGAEILGKSHLSYAPVDFWIPQQEIGGWLIRKSILPRLTLFQPAYTASVLVKSDHLRLMGGWDECEAIRNSAEDTCFAFKCLSEVPFGVVPEILVYYRRHPESLSADELKQLRGTIKVWDHIIRTYPAARQCSEQLEAGLVLMKREASSMTAYRRRQSIKAFFKSLRFWDQ